MTYTDSIYVERTKRNLRDDTTDSQKCFHFDYCVTFTRLNKLNHFLSFLFFFWGGIFITLLDGTAEERQETG